MKREELVRYDGEWYDANIVDCLLDEKDAEIAELKAENLNLKAKNIELQSFYNLHGNVDNYIDKLKAENESLKAKLADSMATVAFNYLDAVTREHRLRRALWLARALRARDIQRWWIAATCAPTTERACRVWNNIEIKCLKKAEEYK